MPDLSEQAARVAESLYPDMRDLLMMCPDDKGFVASELQWSRPGPTGNALTKLAARGALTHSSDREKRGRLRYHITPLGLAVREILQSQQARP